MNSGEQIQILQPYKLGSIPQQPELTHGNTAHTEIRKTLLHRGTNTS